VMVRGPPEGAGQEQVAVVVAGWVLEQVWAEVGGATMGAPTAPEATVSVYTVTPAFPTRLEFHAPIFGAPPAVSPWFGKSCITIGKRADGRYRHSKREGRHR